MQESKTYKAFNTVILSSLIIIGLLLVVMLILTKTSLFSKEDKYGCNNSAGFAYSFALQKCVNVFDNALKLQPTHSKDPNALKGFLIFSLDNKSADLFLPNKIHVLLQGDSNLSSWSDNQSIYLLKNLNNKLSLTKDSKEIYYINR